METILWAIDLVALVGLCFWALRQDKLEQDANKPNKRTGR